MLVEPSRLLKVLLPVGSHNRGEFVDGGFNSSIADDVNSYVNLI